MIAKVQGGSFGQFIARATGTVSLKESSHIMHFSKKFFQKDIVIIPILIIPIMY